MMRFEDDEEGPEDLTAWLAAGLRRIDAQAWRKWHFSLDEATGWRKAGIRDALTAAQWQAAGVDPGSVGEWVRARITAAEAIRWHEFGVTLEQAREHAAKGLSPDDVLSNRHQTSGFSSLMYRAVTQGRAGSAAAGIQRFLNAGVPHNVMAGYLQTQWTDEEALVWARNGIQCWDARLWQRIGLTAAEAGELTKESKSPADVYEQWWRAGIPFDEVADWLGAGLSPEEAIEQRKSGVTVEQAAALRALRRGGAV